MTVGNDKDTFGFNDTMPLPSYLGIDWEKALIEFASKQEPLDEEFSKILHDNLWELYS